MEKYFKKNVKGIIISHRNYLDFNLLCKICYKKVPVFTITGDGTRITKFKKDEINFGKYINHSLIKFQKKKNRSNKNIKTKTKTKIFWKGWCRYALSKKSAFKKRNIKFNFQKNRKKYQF